MLLKIRKECVELNDCYNVIINKKARYEIEYKILKKQVEEFECERDENENIDEFVELIRNTLIKIDFFVITIITFKKLFNSLIFTNDKKSNIEN